MHCLQVFFLQKLKKLRFIFIIYRCIVYTIYNKKMWFTTVGFCAREASVHRHFKDLNSENKMYLYWLYHEKNIAGSIYFKIDKMIDW